MPESINDRNVGDEKPTQVIAPQDTDEVVVKVRLLRVVTVEVKTQTRLS
jgi:hypothetical protein